ncbi:acetate uptake transporter [Lysinimonas soli]|uniref:Acetate uptake transporter n=1 Tax=Lysinimonas soli TaxID=1074233 RepID=A0ABW0NQ87_9MICO
MSDLNAPTPAGSSFADPGALGLGGFALTTFVLSMANSGFVAGAGVAVLGLALFYGGIAQFAAGIWEFARGNTFAATAFCSFGAFWLAFWFLVVSKGDAGAGGAGVGVFLLAWTIFTAYMTIAAIKTNMVVLLVFIALTVTFLFLTLGAFTSQAVMTHIGGYLGLLTAAFAWYGSFATVLNSTFKRTVLPVGPAS